MLLGAGAGADADADADAGVYLDLDCEKKRTSLSMVRRKYAVRSRAFYARFFNNYLFHHCPRMPVVYESNRGMSQFVCEKFDEPGGETTLL
jgi:hypothetical protein